MYLEFLILIIDYFKTLKIKTVIYEVLIPLIISGISFYLLYTGKNTTMCSDFRNNVLTLLGILLGFSITIITILTTGNSRNLIAIQEKETEHVIGGKKVSLFDLLLINFTYSVVLEILLIIMLLLQPLIFANFNFSLIFKILGFAILSGAVVHVLLLTMRNLTDFYLILMKK